MNQIVKCSTNSVIRYATSVARAPTTDLFFCVVEYGTIPMVGRPKVILRCLIPVTQGNPTDVIKVPVEYVLRIHLLKAPFREAGPRDDKE